MTTEDVGAAGPRHLTVREREVLVRMIREGSRDGTVLAGQDAEDRRRWLAQVDTARVHGRCACRACPTVDLGDDDAPAPSSGSRVVLGAWLDHAAVLLFVVGDRLSLLELAPFDDTRFPEFPPASDLTS